MELATLQANGESQEMVSTTPGNTAAGLGMNRNHEAVLKGSVARAGSQEKVSQLEREAMLQLPMIPQVFFQLPATCPPTSHGSQCGLEPDKVYI